ncbi:MAG: CinA family protein [Puniceicoccales bacterium]|jgi:PncC family amidohydrolase|nr:CinA family protein [Puniceicoccales bacterium]
MSERWNVIATTIVERLKEQHQTVSAAESCTGGLLCAALTGVPGASDAFPGGTVAYSSEVKRRMGVLEANLRDDAVNADCAKNLADLTAEAHGTTFAIGITGVAGPGGGKPGIPVGTVYIGWHTPEGTLTRHFCFSGTREEVRAQAVSAALEELLRLLPPAA